MKGWEVVSTADPKNKDLDHVSFKGRFGKKMVETHYSNRPFCVVCRDKRITEAFQKDKRHGLVGKTRNIREAQERMAKAVKDKTKKSKRRISTNCNLL
jgi:hypothetical protein